MTFFENKRNIVTAIYQTVLTVLFIIGLCFIMFGKMFVSLTNSNASLNMFSILLAPTDRSALGVENYNCLLPALFVLVPGLIIFIHSYIVAMKGYNNRGAMYVSYDSKHCCTYLKSGYIKSYTILFFISVIGVSVSTIIKPIGITDNAIFFSFAIFCGAMIFYILSFFKDYLVNDGVSKSNLKNPAKSEVSDLLPVPLDVYSIYKPDHLTVSNAAFRIYTVAIVSLTAINVILLLFFPLYSINKFGISIERVTLSAFLANFKEYMLFGVSTGDNVLGIAIDYINNCKNIFLTIGWFYYLTKIICFDLPYYLMSSIFGLTRQDILTYSKKLTRSLILTGVLWFVTTSGTIYTYALTPNEGIIACIVPLFVFVNSGMAFAISKIASKGFKYYISKEIEHSSQTFDELWREFNQYKRECIGPVACDYYVRSFENGISWNWCAFLFGPIWFAYRKMYKYAISICAINFAINLISEIIIISKTGYTSVELCETNLMENPEILKIMILLFAVVPIVKAIIIGLIGNMLYKIHCDEFSMAAQCKDPVCRLQFISAKSGTSGWAIFVMILVNFAMLIVESVLVGLM